MTCWVAEAPRPALEREQGRAPVLPTSCPILGANWVVTRWEQERQAAIVEVSVFKLCGGDGDGSTGAVA